jgi:glycogen synthase
VNICFVSDCYPLQPSFGGIAVYTRQIARALVRRGHAVHVVVTLSEEIADVEDEGIHVHYRPVKWTPGLVSKLFPGFGESLRVARILAGLNRVYHFDIIEIPHWEGMALASLFTPRLRVLIRLHTSLAESVKMANRAPTQAERFMIWAERVSARRARVVVTHSAAHREQMIASYGRRDIALLPHGMEIPEQYSFPVGKQVLAIGRITAPRKGMETLLDAIPVVMKEIPDASFQIVGTDESHARIRRFRADFPALTEVRFFNRVDQTGLSKLYDECAIYVSPAVYESFGLTFVEAMSHGRPVVGCKSSAIPEIVRDGVDGILVPPWSAEALAAAIVKLLSTPALMLEMSKNARRRAAEMYSIDAAADRIEQTFKQAAGLA